MKKSIFIISLLTSYILLGGCDPIAKESETNDERPFIITPADIPNTGILFVDHEINHRSGHGGHAMTECKNGDIIAFYMNVWAENWQGHSCAGWSSYKRSTDGGKTWGDPVDFEYSVELWNRTDVLSGMVFDVTTAPNGTLIATVIRFKHARWDVQYPPAYLLSHDNGHTWDGPYEFDESVTAHDISITFGATFVRENEVFIVFNGDSIPYSPVSDRPHSLWVSDNNGESFSQRSVLPFDGARYYETAAVLDNGDIIVYTYPWSVPREEIDEFNLEYVISKDGGFTWSEVKTTYFAKALRNPQMSEKIGDYYFIHGRSGSYRHNRPAHDNDPGPQNFVLYSSKDGINWCDGVLLVSRDKTPGQSDFYSGNTVIGKYDPSTPKRLLIQADVSYDGTRRVNIHHWWVELL